MIRGALIGLVALGLIASPARAQGPAGADHLTSAAIVDSQRTLDAMAQRISSNANDAEAWYRRGMIAWALADRARAANPPRELDATRLGTMADTSLRIAAQLARGNVLYQLMTGRFLLASGVAMTRLASVDFFQAAADAAKPDVDPSLRAEAFVAYGRVFWRRYDAVAYRWNATASTAIIRSVGEAMHPPCVDAPPPGQCAPREIKIVRELITSGASPMSQDGGDLQRAEALFQQAYEAMPSNPHAMRSYAMVFAERSDWKGLERLARRQIENRPWDAWGWLSLGLATHRQRNDKEATAAFDSAMRLLNADDRDRLDRLDRVLPAGDTSRAVRGAPPERAAYKRLYWAMADPLWTKNGNESHNEYLSRVTFAELRWTVEEMNVRGADTDRGNIFIRYGPPEIQASFPSAAGAEQGTQISLVWIYGTDLAFAFTGQPTFATMRTPPNDDRLVDGISRAQPVRWDNIVRPTIDSMATQVARFRGGKDSVDVFIAADVHAGEIRASQAVSEPVQSDVWFMNGSAVVSFHDSTQLTADGVRTWRHRVAPDAFLYRVQAMSETAVRAARATGVIDASASANGVALAGTSMSDILLASTAESRSAVPERWTDVTIAPITNSIARGGSIAIVWENYELGNRDGNARYAIAITVVRERTGAGRVAASILGGLASAARITRGNDRVTISYDRTVRHAPVLVDDIAVSLGDTPPGNYLVSVQVTDQTTGKAMTRTRALTIRD